MLAQARAIDNQVFLVASGCDHPAYITNPEGTRIAGASEWGTSAAATIDLASRQLPPSLGETRARRMKERRLDVRVP